MFCAYLSICLALCLAMYSFFSFYLWTQESMSSSLKLTYVKHSVLCMKIEPNCRGMLETHLIMLEENSRSFRILFPQLKMLHIRRVFLSLRSCFSIPMLLQASAVSC